MQQKPNNAQKRPNDVQQKPNNAQKKPNDVQQKPNNALSRNTNSACRLNCSGKLNANAPRKPKTGNLMLKNKRLADAFA